MAEREGLGQCPRIASTPGSVNPLEHWLERPIPICLLSRQAYSQACTQHGSLWRESVKRTALQRGHALGLSQKPMLAHPHATETECGTCEGHYFAFSLSQVCGTVKERTRLGQAPTGQDSFGPFHGQGGSWPGEGRGVVELNGLAEQCRCWLKAVHHLQCRGCLSGYLHGNGSVGERATGGNEGVMRSA